MLRIQKSAKSSLSGIFRGKALKLREGVYKELREREWIFNRAENDIIFLVHKSGDYGVVVNTGDIDWDAQ
jgi:hypothetical protein